MEKCVHVYRTCARKCVCLWIASSVTKGSIEAHSRWASGLSNTTSCSFVLRVAISCLLACSLACFLPSSFPPIHGFMVQWGPRGDPIGQKLYFDNWERFEWTEMAGNTSRNFVDRVSGPFGVTKLPNLRNSWCSTFSWFSKARGCVQPGGLRQQFILKHDPKQIYIFLGNRNTTSFIEIRYFCWLK